MTGPRTSSLYKAVHDDPSTPGLDTPLNEPGPSNIPSGTIVYSKKAPKVPESVIARSKVNKSHAKLRANVRKATDGDDDALKKILEKMHADNAEDIDMQNPNTKRLREAVLVTWAIFLTEIRPDLSSDNHWDHSIVQSYAKTYLEYRACYTRGRKGGSIKASTLTQTLSNLVHCVWNYTTDAHGNRAGKKLLTEGGLHKKLEDKVKQLITEYELDRYEDEKVYYGRHEVRLMIAEAMSNSQTAGSGRLPKVQTVCTTLFPMFCTVRPSSLGPNNPQFEKEGKFPRLGDLRVFRRAYMTYDIQFDCKHFKGHNEGLGRWLVFLLQSVERCHNVVFDPTLWIIAYLFLRGAFDFPTLEEFFSFEGAEVVIKDDKKKEPLFCQSTPGGRDLETTKPISSKSISECVATLAINVGLPRAGLGALRRESGNNFGITMGKHVAAMILNHREEATTFDLHYSRNTGNYPVVGIQLGEISSVENDEMTKRMLALNDFSRAAVTALLTQKSIASWDVEKDGEKIVERKSVKGKTRSAVPVLSQSAKAEIEDDKIIKNASDTFTKRVSNFQTPERKIGRQTCKTLLG
ncbi:hypothetical protein BD410DRAFT_327599 [Rickenella mellea]|uniref:Uncharacterized protein n=1 Tax=Rickenella mellea TaxID=50990 RepID=A0A4Y7QKJ4_9AGAM|nr:hypothetical protein BD410DRAFT_327599 [Rickenella mellea]